MVVACCLLAVRRSIASAGAVRRWIASEGPTTNGAGTLTLSGLPISSLALPIIMRARQGSAVGFQTRVKNCRRFLISSRATGLRQMVESRCKQLGTMQLASAGVVKVSRCYLDTAAVR